MDYLKKTFMLKKHLENITGLSITIIVLISCTATKNTNRINYYELLTLPGTIRISQDLYCDEMEITNLDWVEYMSWTTRIFGKNSQEYISTLPDTTVWVKYDTSLKLFVNYYLHYPAYYDFPVVGISQNQAISYSKWRSDRVFEMILVSCGSLKFDSTQKKEMYFSIERYFSGTYKDIIPDSNYKYYPDYRLPSLTDRQRILSYSDSVDNNYSLKNKAINYKKRKLMYPELESYMSRSFKDTFLIVPVPTVPVTFGCIPSKVNPIYNLRGNVSEWTSEKGISVGGSWADKSEIISKTDTVRLENQNAWTGFRNVCKWKVWNKNAIDKVK
jgi:hypothetical protein